MTRNFHEPRRLAAWDVHCGATKNDLDVGQFTLVSVAVRYTGVTALKALETPAPISTCRSQPLEGATTMTKFVLAAVAALSLIASPVLAGPVNTSAPTSYNGDFQLQGR